LFDGLPIGAEPALLQRRWVDFAASGMPGAGWPRFTPAEARGVVFGASGMQPTTLAPPPPCRFRSML
jgi:hypothetical protein